MEKLEIETKSSKNTKTKPKNTQKPNQRKVHGKTARLDQKRLRHVQKKTRPF